MSKKKPTKPAAVAPEPVVVVEPPAPVDVAPADTLEPGEVIRDEKEQTIRIDGVVFHHVRESINGQWIYAPLKNRNDV